MRLRPTHNPNLIRSRRQSGIYVETLIDKNQCLMCAQFNKLDLKGQKYYAGLDYYPAG